MGPAVTASYNIGNIMIITTANNQFTIVETVINYGYTISATYSHIIVNTDDPVEIIQMNNPTTTKTFPVSESKKNPIVIMSKETIVTKVPIWSKGFRPNLKSKKLTNISAIALVENKRTGMSVASSGITKEVIYAP